LIIKVSQFATAFGNAEKFIALVPQGTTFIDVILASNQALAQVRNLILKSLHT